MTLTVTDDDGATASTTRDVTVAAPPNQAPVAAFTATATDLSVSVDASGSSDPDGTVAGFAWDFGDGATASGATASHAYGAAGTYTVTLTVTDDDGATASTTRDVTVTAPPEPGDAFAADSFGRTMAGGWGIAEAGGAWTGVGTASRFSVDGSTGVHTMVAGGTLTSSLDAVGSTSTSMRVTVTADKVPSGGGAFVQVQGRRVSATDFYGARLRLQADGSVQLHVTRNGTPLSGGVVSGLTFAAGDELEVLLEVDGTSPTTVRAKVWKAGDAEPATWRASVVDSTAVLQAPGGVGISTYLFGSATNGPVRFGYDDLTAGPVE